MCFTCKAFMTCLYIKNEFVSMFPLSVIKQVCYWNRGLFVCYMKPGRDFNYETFKETINNKSNCQYHSIIRDEYGQYDESVQIFVRCITKN